MDRATINADPQTPAEVPASPRWGALLGAVVLVPFGFILLTSSDSTEQLLGIGLMALAVYLVAGAFVPRLLRFGGGDVPIHVAVPVMLGVEDRRGGADLGGGVLLHPAALAGVRRRQAAASRRSRTLTAGARRHLQGAIVECMTR
jgi:hypothetical protein